VFDGEKDSSSLDDFKRKKQKFLALDKKGRLVYLSDSEFTLKMTQQNYGDLKFNFTSEF
jgi:peptide chain release factor 3